MRRVGRATRAALGAQVLLALVLAFGGCALLVELSDYRYVRYDLSVSGRNTLDDAILDVVENLPEKVEVDVFFRGLQPPYQGVVLEAQQRMLEVLRTAMLAHRDKIEVVAHDLRNFDQVQARQSELGVEGVNLIVYSCGGRRTVQKLFGDVAVIDWGNPTEAGVQYLTRLGIQGVVDPRRWDPSPDAFRPPALSSFRGEESFTRALLKVASGGAPKVYFSSGEGEPGIHGTLETDLGALRGALEADGFEVLEWDPADGAGVPADCAVLALIGATQPFPSGALESIRSYVEGGGRVVAAPSFQEVEQGTDGGIVELLRSFRLSAAPGIVCEFVTGNSGEKLDGFRECATLFVDERGMSKSHELTEPLIQRARRVQFAGSHSFDVVYAQAGGMSPLALIHSSADSWRDLPIVQGGYDFAYDRQAEERGRYPLVALTNLTSSVAAEDGAVKRGQVLGIAGSSFLLNGTFPTNRDFLLNAFNWLAEREHRLRVSPLADGASFLDLQRGSTRPLLTWGLWVVLPGLCIAMGAFFAWRRRG